MRFPTISVGYTISSRMASWTAVRVLDLGRGPFWLLERLTDCRKIEMIFDKEMVRIHVQGGGGGRLNIIHVSKDRNHFQ